MGGDVAITYRADSAGQVDKFLGQLKKAAAPDPVGILCLACRLLRDKPKVDFPPVESFTVNGDTTVNVSGSASVQGPYAKPPKSKADGDDEDDPGVTDTRATGKAEVAITHAIGRDALHERAQEGPDHGLLRGQRLGRAVGRHGDRPARQRRAGRQGDRQGARRRHRRLARQPAHAVR